MTLQTITNAKYHVKMKETARVKDLETEIYKSSGIRSRVKLLLNKEELADRKQLMEYQIEDGKVIQLLIIPPTDINLTVHVFKKGKVVLKISDNNTPGELRDLLMDKKYSLGVSPKIYDMYYNSNKLEYDKPVHLQGIVKDSHIYMKCVDATCMVTLVDAFSFTMTQFLEVRETDNVSDVKARVIETINESSGKDEKASRDNVVLFHQQGDDYTALDSNQLEKYEVKPYDYLYYVWYKSFEDSPQINYQGQLRHIYGATPLETTISLKLKIQDQLGIPIRKQHLNIPGLIKPDVDDKVRTIENLSLRMI